MQKSLRLLPMLCSLVALLFLTSCNSIGSGPSEPPKGVKPYLAAFFLEVRGEASGAAPLPKSGIRVPVGSSAVLRETDIAGVTLGRTEHLGQCLIFQFRKDAARAISTMTIRSLGLRLVLSLNGQMVGVTNITSPINNGTIVIIPELDEDQFPGVIDGINNVTTELDKQLR